MIVIGLTGPTGSGKSTVASLAQQQGFIVLDCDKIAREVVDKGSETLVKLAKFFGDDILCSDGTLNRKVLAEKAFGSWQNTERLNGIMLPAVSKKIELAINSLPKNSFVLLDAPTLFESGEDRRCDDVIAVLSDEKLRKMRILSRDNLTEQAADIRLSAGKDDEYYLNRTEYILYNNGDLDQLKNSANKFLNSLKGNDNVKKTF